MYLGGKWCIWEQVGVDLNYICITGLDGRCLDRLLPVGFITRIALHHLISINTGLTAPLFSCQCRCYCLVWGNHPDKKENLHQITFGCAITFPQFCCSFFVQFNVSHNATWGLHSFTFGISIIFTRFILVRFQVWEAIFPWLTPRGHDKGCHLMDEWWIMSARRCVFSLAYLLRFHHHCCLLQHVLRLENCVHIFSRTCKWLFQNNLGRKSNTRVEVNLKHPRPLVSGSGCLSLTDRLAWGAIAPEAQLGLSASVRLWLHQAWVNIQFSVFMLTRFKFLIWMWNIL